MRTRWLRTGVAAAVAAFAAVLCLAAVGDPLDDLKAASAAVDGQRYAAAIAQLKPLSKRLPKLSDYVAWFLATAEFATQDYAGVPSALEPVWKHVPASPLAPRATLLGAQAFVRNGKADDALALLKKNYASLPQPAGDLAMATGFAAADDDASAATYYQRIYFSFPASNEAAQAESFLTKLRTELGDRYPTVSPSAMLGRAIKLLDGGQTARGRKELEALLPRLTGAERDAALVRIGVADYVLNETAMAHRYLAALEVTSPDADAERLHYLLQSARRLKNQAEVDQTLDKLARLYPNSKWRLESLRVGASHYLNENQMDAYEPLYRACYESFPKEPQAADCHWRVVWGHYLHRQPDAAELLRAHLRMFPASEDAPGALYFLGRLAEYASDRASAKAFYDEIIREYPNHYYAILAREQTAQIGAVAPAPAVSEFLHGVAFPPRTRINEFEPNATAKARIERARMLVSAGLEDLAEGELRYGAQNEDQPQVLAMELASISSGREGPDQAMRYIKHYAGWYLFLPVASAPPAFWKLAFPLPYRADLERFSKQNSLDPFLMAALIRQESEFNAKALSRSNARGLMQIMPATGRDLSRRLKITTFTTAKLYQPVMSLQLGTFYLRTILDNLNGNWEATLAAYNAGLSRAHSWMSWAEFREPAEFVETVPFSETRNYIKSVLRNADVYRRVYGSDQRASVSYSHDSQRPATVGSTNSHLKPPVPIP